jgi:hypothetical protein
MENLDSKPTSTEQTELTDKLSIRHGLVGAFHYREYRHSNFDDAQAARDLEK